MVHRRLPKQLRRCKPIGTLRAVSVFYSTSPASLLPRLTVTGTQLLECHRFLTNLHCRRLPLPAPILICPVSRLSLRHRCKPIGTLRAVSVFYSTSHLLPQ